MNRPDRSGAPAVPFSLLADGATFTIAGSPLLWRKVSRVRAVVVDQGHAATLLFTERRFGLSDPVAPR